MRIDLGIPLPKAAAPATSITPVAEVSGRMALEMAANVLASKQAPSPVLSPQMAPSSFGPLQSPASSAATATALTPTPMNVVATTPAGPAPVATAPTPAASPDRITLSAIASNIATAGMLAMPASGAMRTRASAETRPATSHALLQNGHSTNGKSETFVHAGADRVTLSRAAAAVLTEMPALASKPSGQFLLQALEALTGEPLGQLQLLALKTSSPSSVSASYAPPQATDTGPDVLSLFAQGSIRSLDQKIIPFGLNVAASRGDAATVVLPNPQAAASLMQGRIVLDYPGIAADLAGHSLNFQAALDPRALWPMQSFLLSGFLTLGPARTKDLEDELLDALQSEDEPDEDEEPARKRKKKGQTLAEDEVTPLADDGGPPIITGRRWLELEMRHLRGQMRLWMGFRTLAP